MTHRIRHQIIELELPREAGAVAMQRRFSRLFQEEVLPKLDVVFSRIAPSDRVIRIEDLTIDLGDIGESNWEQTFIEACVAQISRQIEETVFEVGAAGHTRSLTLRTDESQIDILRYFLQHGILPWYAKGVILKDLERDLFEKTDQICTPYQTAFLRQLWLQNPAALQRWVWQFSADFTEAVMARVVGVPAAWIREQVRLHEGELAGALSSRERIVFYDNLLQYSTMMLSAAVAENASMKSLFQENNDPFAGPNRAAKQAQEDSIPLPTNRKKVPSAEALLPKNAPSAAAIEGIAVEKAGLVLLAVYLPAFFQKLGLQLIENESDRHRATHLLHYLATGGEQPEEPLLILPKVLCGLDLTEAVPQDIELTETEKTASNLLLEAVIRNWPVLKNTSPDALRHTFLQRDGILSWQASQQSWLLQVERKGQDLLLDRLPWTFGTIRLGWMGEMINTEW
jgi:hypothetical protein